MMTDVENRRHSSAVWIGSIIEEGWLYANIGDKVRHGKARNGCPLLQCFLSSAWADPLFSSIISLRASRMQSQSESFPVQPCGNAARCPMNWCLISARCQIRKAALSTRFKKHSNPCIAYLQLGPQTSTLHIQLRRANSSMWPRRPYKLGTPTRMMLMPACGFLYRWDGKQLMRMLMSHSNKKKGKIVSHFNQARGVNRLSLVKLRKSMAIHLLASYVQVVSSYTQPRYAVDKV